MKNLEVRKKRGNKSFNYYTRQKINCSKETIYDRNIRPNYLNLATMERRQKFIDFPINTKVDVFKQLLMTISSFSLNRKFCLWIVRTIFISTIFSLIYEGSKLLILLKSHS